MKGAWYLPDKYPETRKDRSNSDWGTWFIIIWHYDSVIRRHDDMTNWSRWSLFYFGIRHDIVSVRSSNHFFSQQLNNYPTNRLLLSITMPMLNSRTFQSASGVNTITRLVPKRSGGNYLSGQQVVVANLVLIDWRLICHNLDSWYGLHRPSPFPGVQDLGDGRLPLGASPLQPWRVGETQGARTNRSSPMILVENH